jgi:hypothetical protein
VDAFVAEGQTANLGLGGKTVDFDEEGEAGLFVSVVEGVRAEGGVPFWR